MTLLDVHAHFLPETYRRALEAAGHTQPDGFPAIPEWSADGHVELLDRVGIRTALLSISSPGVHFGDDAEAGRLARTVNEEGRRAVEAHPGRFGLLVALPLPDVDGALAEIAHAFDELHADGVALLTNVDDTYLGDPALEPVFDELDRRRARVLVHPTSPACWERTALGRPRPMVEFLFDTTRAVVDLVLNGTVARHPDIAFIIPHAGAALPAIVDRVAAFSAVLTDVPRRRPPTPRRRSPPTSAAAATPASSRWGAISRRSSWLPEEQPDGHLRNRFGPHNPDDTDVEQGFAEQLVDLGEVAAVGASATGRAWSPPPPRCCRDGWPAPGAPAEPPQNLKEYDPEWGRAFWTGSVAASCDHDRMLRSVRVPVLFTHHFRAVDPASGLLIGAATDGQAEAARNRLAEAGVPVDHRSYETTGHSMHGDDPRLFVDTLLDWTAALPSAPTLR